MYGPGRVTRRAIDEARVKVANCIEAHPEQVIFTSSATEANNAAIHSALLIDPAKRHVVTSEVEHSAILGYCEYLEKYHQVKVTKLPVDKNGMLSVDSVRDAIRSDTAIVSLMWANNETGVIWPIAEFAAVCLQRGIHFHTDAVQAVGKVQVQFRSSSVSYLSLSGHKFGAPKGVGALIVADPDKFIPLLFGGKQENGHRGGTENLANIVALGTAADLSTSCGGQEWAHLALLRDEVERSLTTLLAGVEVHGSTSQRLPNTSNLYLPGLDSDSLVTYLDRQGICVSSGSACLESAITPSHVIFGMSGSYERASESIRISIGSETTKEDLQKLHSAISGFVAINL